jgi:hypothetical protein
VKEVVVSRSIDAPRADVEAVLSPTRIVEYAGTYEVRAVEETGDAVVVTAGTDELAIDLEFTQTESAYVYRQIGDQGPFAEMYTSVSLAGDEPIEVTARTCFTFGLPLPRLTDWFAASERRVELRRLVAGVEAAALDG